MTTYRPRLEHHGCPSSISSNSTRQRCSTEGMTAAHSLMALAVAQYHQLLPIVVGDTDIHTAACSAGGGAGGQAAKDALGNDVKVSSWLETHKKGDYSLTQGLKVRL